VYNNAEIVKFLPKKHVFSPAVPGISFDANFT